MDHEAVEGVMPFMDQDLSLTVYVRTLKRLYGIVAAWEEQASRSAPEWLQPTLAARARSGMLASDLAVFGETPSSDRASLPPFAEIDSLLGAMYVMEGSTLGGQYIARHVEKTFGFEPGQGNAFFLGHGTQTGSMWKEFCSMLETRVPEDKAEDVVVSAKTMFAAFSEWMQSSSDSI